MSLEFIDSRKVDQRPTIRTRTRTENQERHHETTFFDAKDDHAYKCVESNRNEAK